MFENLVRLVARYSNKFVERVQVSSVYTKLLNSKQLTDNTTISLREVNEEGGGEGGSLTLKDLDKQLLAHVAANTTSPPQNLSIFSNQYK